MCEVYYQFKIGWVFKIKYKFGHWSKMDLNLVSYRLPILKLANKNCVKIKYTSKTVVAIIKSVSKFDNLKDKIIFRWIWGSSWAFVIHGDFLAICKLGLEFLKINLTHDINTIQYQYHTKGPGLALEHPNEKV